MAKTSALFENTLITLLGGIITALVNAIGAAEMTGSLLLWSFVTGVFVVSLSVVIGKVTAGFLK